MSQEIPELEPEAEELIKRFPKNPLVYANIYSISVSLKRIADALTTGSATIEPGDGQSRL